MAREFNTELLNTFKGTTVAEARTGPEAPAAPLGEIRALHLHVENLNKKLKEFESRLESMTAKVNDVTSQNRQRFERVQGHFQRQTEMLQKGFADVHGKLAQVVSRVNERRVEDGVVKEMVERHAQVVQAFEVRLQQLQRVISEQELQLMNARSELKEAIKTIAQLKKL